MKITQYLTCYLESQFRAYYVMESNKGKTNFDELSFYLNSDFTYLFDKTGNLNLDHLYDPETDYTLNGEETCCGLDVANKLIYIIPEYEANEYYTVENVSIDEDPSYLELAMQNRIPYETIPLDNFIELMNDWYKIWKGQTPFALLYQDEKDWIHCKAFDSEEEMDQLIKQHS